MLSQKIALRFIKDMERNAGETKKLLPVSLLGPTKGHKPHTFATAMEK